MPLTILTATKTAALAALSYRCATRACPGHVLLPAHHAAGYNNCQLLSAACSSTEVVQNCIMRYCLCSHLHCIQLAA